MTRLRPILFGLCTLALLAGCDDSSLTGAENTDLSSISSNAPAVYEVTVANLTGGQPFSPPVLATHCRPADVFTVGEAASAGIQAIAENGNNVPLAEALSGDKHVFDWTQGTAPLVPASDPGATGFGSSATYTVEAAEGAKYLSAAWMLICTNDGFSGVDGVRLPKKVGDAETFATRGYDAGTEVNTEDFADLVPPCQGLIGVSSGDAGTGQSDLALAEGDVVRMHPGIQGGDDLLAGLHGWMDPVAHVTVRRVQ